MKALPDHQPETLKKLGRKLFDLAARMHRQLPTDDSDKVLRCAATALRHAHERFAGQPHSDYVYAARELNDAIAMVNWLREKRGEEPLP